MVRIHYHLSGNVPNEGIGEDGVGVIIIILFCNYLIYACIHASRSGLSAVSSWDPFPIK